MIYYLDSILGLYDDVYVGGVPPLVMAVALVVGGGGGGGRLLHLLIAQGADKLLQGPGLHGAAGVVLVLGAGAGYPRLACFLFLLLAAASLEEEEERGGHGMFFRTASLACVRGSARPEAACVRVVLAGNFVAG